MGGPGSRAERGNIFQKYVDTGPTQNILDIHEVFIFISLLYKLDFVFLLLLTKENRS